MEEKKKRRKGLEKMSIYQKEARAKEKEEKKLRGDFFLVDFFFLASSLFPCVFFSFFQFCGLNLFSFGLDQKTDLKKSAKRGPKRVKPERAKKSLKTKRLKDKKERRKERKKENKRDKKKVK